MTSSPKLAHELIKDPVLGDFAGAVNSIACDLYMVQVQDEDTDAWLRRAIRDSEALALAARNLLEKRAAALVAEKTS